MITNIDQIVKILCLTNSPKKEDTIKNLIEFVICTLNNNASKSEIKKYIKNEFTIEVNIEDFEDAFKKLLVENKIVNQNNRYIIKNERELILRNSFEKEQNKEQFFLNRLKIFIDSIIENPITDTQKNQIALVYKEYLFESFYQYGSDAINQFDPIYKYKFPNENNLLKKSLVKLESDALKNIFLKIITELPKVLEKEDIDYIESLSTKTECFLSLGLSKELFDEFANLDIINWTLILDTNVIYCILGLDLEPDTEASRKLIELVKQNKLNIKFRYLPQTLKELSKKKRYYDSTVSRAKFTISQIKALIKSGQLDSYTKYYFEQKLIDPNYPHPSDVIDYASHILSGKGILIFQSKFNDLEENKDYLIKEYEKFGAFIRKYNSKNKNHKIEKSIDKIEHDIFLREAILSIRKDDVITLHETKYFGVTLDKILLSYDRNLLKGKNNSVLVPSFFTPTFLIRKLMNIFPLTTNDYKKAFISAISSQAFDNKDGKSVTVQKTVEYFHKLGVDEEDLILQCITDEFFLEEFKNKNGTKEFEEFFQSEIDIFIKKLKKEKDILETNFKDQESELKEKEIKEKKQSNEIKSKDNEIEGLIKKLALTNVDIEQLQERIIKLEENKNSISQIPPEEKILEVIKDKEGKNRIITIDWNLLYNKTKRLGYYFILLLNITMLLIIIFTGIISKSAHYYFTSPLIIGLLIGLIDKIKIKAYFYINCGIAVINLFFIWFNRFEIVNFWHNFFNK
jgi:hypothetical protein